MPMNFSKEEISYVRDCIHRNIRTDLRNLDESRELAFETFNNTQSDGAVKITKGSSEGILSIQFRESEETLIHIYKGNSLSQSQNISICKNTLDSNLPIIKSIEEIIVTHLKGYKLGLRIDFNVVFDDGNIIELFYLGLKFLFSELEVPDINDLNRVIKTKIELPSLKTSCVFGSQIVLDPTKIEEISCNHLIYLFHDKESFISLQTVSTCDNNRGTIPQGLDVNTLKKIVDLVIQ